jgi:hypothetical protein
MRRMHLQCPAAATVLAAAAMVALLAAPASAYRPELAFQLGRSFAVGSELSGSFDQGGYVAAVSALYPWEKRYRFGLQLFAADFGDQIKPVVLADPSGGPSKDYGSVDFGHRGTWGAAWRVDALGPRIFWGFDSFATGTYGYYRQKHDLNGHDLGGELSAVGGSVGLGIEHSMGPSHTLGASANATWMSDKFTRRYGSAVLEWRWHW